MATRPSILVTICVTTLAIVANAAVNLRIKCAPDAETTTQSLLTFTSRQGL